MKTLETSSDNLPAFTGILVFLDFYQRYIYEILPGFAIIIVFTVYYRLSNEKYKKTYLRWCLMPLVLESLSFNTLLQMLHVAAMAFFPLLSTLVK